MSYLTHAGPLIWLVLILGILALVWAVRFALEQRRRDASMAIGATVASAVVALLAAAAGVQKSVGGLRGMEPDERWIFLFGLKESLNNVVVALVFGFLVTVLLMVGSYRRADA